MRLISHNPLGSSEQFRCRAHIETTAGQLIRQPGEAGQRKTVKIPFSQIFSSSSIDRVRGSKYLEISLQCLISSGVCEVLLMVILIAGPKPITVQFFFIYTILCIPHRGAIWGRVSRKWDSMAHFRVLITFQYLTLSYFQGSWETLKII